MAVAAQVRGSHESLKFRRTQVPHRPTPDTWILNHTDKKKLARELLPGKNRATCICARVCQGTAMNA